MYRIQNITILLFAVVFIFSCKQTNGESSAEQAPVEVKTAIVGQSNIREYLTFNGVTQFQKKENIRSNITGYISKMPFEVGDRVSRGQAFAYIRTKEQDALKEAVKIDSTLSKFIHPQRINSNASGTITMLNFFTNDYIAEGDTLATIAHPESLVVQVNVPFQYKNEVGIGTKCEIILPSNDTLYASISGALPKIDIASQSQTFLISLPGEKLPENLSVQIRTIYKEALQVKSIPKVALQSNELLTDFWVMKIYNDTLAIKETVIPLLRNDSVVEISSEKIKLNDRVVTEGSYQMQDSTRINIHK